MINIMQPFEDAVARERARRADADTTDADWLSVTDKTNRVLVLATRYGYRGLIDLAEQLAQELDEIQATQAARRANK